MRTFITESSSIISLAFALLLMAQLSANDVELRFTPVHHDLATNELHVDIELRLSQNGHIVLAGQNYRFYYDSEVMQLKDEDIVSNLSSELFSAVMLDDHLVGIEADHVNQLDFDDNFGFVNFSIEMDNVDFGGLRLSKQDGWVAIASLKFELLEDSQQYDVVWGRRGKSDLYATAFVELSQWIGEVRLDRVDISHYGDLSYSPESADLASEVAVEIGPNPTSDYINIELEESTDERVSISIRDLSGREVRTATIDRGDANTTIQLSDLNAAPYALIVVKAGKGLVHHSMIIIAE